MEPEQIGAVKCHGTATPYNDAMEAKALHLLFGDTYPPCVSLKGALGHLSGAGSLIEICIVAECLKRRHLPPTKGYNTHGVDEPIPVSAKTQRIDIPSVLCLSAGFGGLNAAVIIQEKV
jgi:3-oxoacyl-(acyl-carrier-protein) synthase